MPGSRNRPQPVGPPRRATLHRGSELPFSSYPKGGRGELGWSGRGSSPCRKVHVSATPCPPSEPRSGSRSARLNSLLGFCHDVIHAKGMCLGLVAQGGARSFSLK
jgi:hypothetical protein